MSKSEGWQHASENLEPQELVVVQPVRAALDDPDPVVQPLPEGERDLAPPAFAQRVAVDYGLRPLDREQTQAYIHHGLSIGNPAQEGIFTPEARVGGWLFDPA